jgi:hypothetical protein
MCQRILREAGRLGAGVGVVVVVCAVVRHAAGLLDLDDAVTMVTSLEATTPTAATR